MREWVNQRKYTIEKVCGIQLEETDFTDDRLTILLRKLSYFGRELVKCGIYI